ncbi:unnamed protein product, partial [Meganyctiphanes norvegica]
KLNIPDEKVLEEFASKTEGWTGAELENLIRKGLLNISSGSNVTINTSPENMFSSTIVSSCDEFSGFLSHGPPVLRTTSFESEFSGFPTSSHVDGFTVSINAMSTNEFPVFFEIYPAVNSPLIPTWPTGYSESFELISTRSMLAFMSSTMSFTNEFSGFHDYTNEQFPLHENSSDSDLLVERAEPPIQVLAFDLGEFILAPGNGRLG